MSVAEMKIKAMSHLVNLNGEEAVKEILEHLEKLNISEKKVMNLSEHYNTIKEQYGDVLEKLAK
jgi:nicotinic acid phosphoribosyltransferase